MLFGAVMIDSCDDEASGVVELILMIGAESPQNSYLSGCKELFRLFFTFHAFICLCQKSLYTDDVNITVVCSVVNSKLVKSIEIDTHKVILSQLAGSMLCQQ